MNYVSPLLTQCRWCVCDKAWLRTPPHYPSVEPGRSRWVYQWACLENHLSWGRRGGGGGWLQNKAHYWNGINNHSMLSLTYFTTQWNKGNMYHLLEFLNYHSPRLLKGAQTLPQDNTTGNDHNKHTQHSIRLKASTRTSPQSKQVYVYSGWNGKPMWAPALRNSTCIGSNGVEVGLTGILSIAD